MKFNLLRRTCLVAALAIGMSLGLASCASAPQATVAATAKPKLIVFMVVDGLPQRQVLNYRDQLVPDGFARFLDRGTWFANANYGHAFTVTAAGHAAMLTGAYPTRSGITGNDWLDPATGAPVYNTGDTSAVYIGHATRPLDGTSPKNLKAETVGDVLRRLDPQSKVESIGLRQLRLMQREEQLSAIVYRSRTCVLRRVAASDLDQREGHADIVPDQ